MREQQGHQSPVTLPGHALPGRLQKARQKQRERDELAKHGVARLEDRPCAFCREPVGHVRMTTTPGATTAVACLKDECQYQRRRRMNRASCQRYYLRRTAMPGFRRPPKRVWPEHPCAREGCKNVTTNRLLCTPCFKNEDRAT